jgi:hypothetical protein
VIDLDAIEQNHSLMAMLRDLGIDGLVSELREARIILNLTEEFSMGIALELVKPVPNIDVVMDLNSQLLEALD